MKLAALLPLPFILPLILTSPIPTANPPVIKKIRFPQKTNEEPNNCRILAKNHEANTAKLKCGKGKVYKQCTPIPMPDENGHQRWRCGKGNGRTVVVEDLAPDEGVEPPAEATEGEMSTNPPAAAVRAGALLSEQDVGSAVASRVPTEREGSVQRRRVGGHQFGKEGPDFPFLHWYVYFNCKPIYIGPKGKADLACHGSDHWNPVHSEPTVIKACRRLVQPRTGDNATQWKCGYTSRATLAIEGPKAPTTPPFISGEDLTRTFPVFSALVYGTSTSSSYSNPPSTKERVRTSAGTSLVRVPNTRPTAVNAVSTTTESSSTPTGTLTVFSEPEPEPASSLVPASTAFTVTTITPSATPETTPVIKSAPAPGVLTITTTIAQPATPEKSSTNSFAPGSGVLTITTTIAQSATLKTAHTSSLAPGLGVLKIITAMTPSATLETTPPADLPTADLAALTSSQQANLEKRKHKKTKDLARDYVKKPWWQKHEFHHCTILNRDFDTGTAVFQCGKKGKHLFKSCTQVPKHDFTDGFSRWKCGPHEKVIREDLPSKENFSLAAGQRPGGTERFPSTTMTAFVPPKTNVWGVTVPTAAAATAAGGAAKTAVPPPAGGSKVMVAAETEGRAVLAPQPKPTLADGLNTTTVVKKPERAQGLSGEDAVMPPQERPAPSPKLEPFADAAANKSSVHTPKLWVSPFPTAVDLMSAIMGPVGMGKRDSDPTPTVDLMTAVMAPVGTYKRSVELEERAPAPPTTLKMVVRSSAGRTMATGRLTTTTVSTGKIGPATLVVPAADSSSRPGPLLGGAEGGE